MQVKYCPECGTKDLMERSECGWKFRCSECETRWAILDVTTQTCGLLELFDRAIEVEAAQYFPPHGTRKPSDKEVSL